MTFKKLANQVEWFFRVFFSVARLSWLFNTVFIGMNPYVTVYSTFSTLIIIGFDSFPNKERKKSSVVLWLRRGQSSHGVQCMSHTFPTSVTAIDDHGNAKKGSSYLVLIQM